jgi:hypothetical protein
VKVCTHAYICAYVCVYGVGAAEGAVEGARKREGKERQCRERKKRLRGWIGFGGSGC